MTKQEMIDKIYEEIAIENWKGLSKRYERVLIGDVLDYLENKGFKILTEDEIGKEEYEKPGIPYGISENNLNQIFRIGKLYGIWYKKRKPIEDQSESSIEYIYNLITDD